VEEKDKESKDTIVQQEPCIRLNIAVVSLVRRILLDNVRRPMAGV
jgi:hypothetical protein